MGSLQMGKVLIVDDDRELLFTIQQMLENEGHEVIVRDNPDAFMDELEESQPDVALVDVKMPDIVGDSLVKQAKEESYSQTKMVLMSSLIDLPKRARMSGADDYLKKPFGYESLWQVVDELLD